MLETKRLSSQYVLLDFLADIDVYKYGKPLNLSQVCTNENLTECEKFVDRFLDPLTEKYGPTSIAGGFWPEVVRKGAHPDGSPHRWTSQHGVAADVVFHNWVNENHPPFHLAHEICESDLYYDRIMSFAGSEFLCLCYRESRNRGYIDEEVRCPDGTISTHRVGSRRTSTPTLEQRKQERRQKLIRKDQSNWRRADDQGVRKTNQFRAQHVRVGRYFVLLDFCRSVEGLRRGIHTVPSVTLHKSDYPQVRVSRMFAEVLDPVVGEFGRISVLRGMEPKPVSDDAVASPHRWDASKSDHSRLVFLVPSDNRAKAMEDRLKQIPHVLSVEPNPHDDDSVEVAVTIEHFEPKTIWTSAGDYTSVQ